MPIPPTTSNPTEIEEEAAKVAPEPTEAQKEAGNYQKGHIKVEGLQISIETPKGGTRSGRGPDGSEWSVEMPAHYGDVRGTEGADGDPVDVYVGEDLAAPDVFVVDQVDAETKEFDEHKAFLGFSDEQQVQDTYDAAFDDGRGPDRRQAITRVPVEEFKAWLGEGNTSQAFAPQQPAEAEVDLAALEEEAEAAARRVDEAKFDFEEGQATRDDFLKARRGLTTAQKALRDARKARAEAAPAPASPETEPAPEPEVEAEPEGWGEKNTIFTSGQRDADIARLAEIASELQSGINPELLAIGTRLAGFHLEAGARKFGDFATALARDLDAAAGRARGTAPSLLPQLLQRCKGLARDGLFRRYVEHRRYRRVVHGPGGRGRATSASPGGE